MPNLPTIDKLRSDDRFQTFVMMTSILGEEFAYITVRRSTRKVVDVICGNGWMLDENGKIHMSDTVSKLKFISIPAIGDGFRTYTLNYDYNSGKLNSETSFIARYMDIDL